jgi:hypothetical protein
MMQFLALLRRDTERFTDADFTPHLPDEAQQRRKLYADAALRQVWNRGDFPGSVMMFEAADQASAQAHLGTLPLVSAGLMLVDALVPLQPYPGFGPR